MPLTFEEMASTSTEHSNFRRSLVKSGIIRSMRDSSTDDFFYLMESISDPEYANKSKSTSDALSHYSKYSEHVLDAAAALHPAGAAAALVLRGLKEHLKSEADAAYPKFNHREFMDENPGEIDVIADRIIDRLEADYIDKNLAGGDPQFLNNYKKLAGGSGVFPQIDDAETRLVDKAGAGVGLDVLREKLNEKSDRDQEKILRDVNKVWELVNDNGERAENWRAETDQKLEEIGDRNEAVLRLIKSERDERQKREAIAKERAESAALRAELIGAVDIIAAIVGADNPKMAKILRLGVRAGLQAHELFGKLAASIAEGGFSFAAAGNFVGAAMTIASLFGENGPDISTQRHQQIMSRLDQISKQIQQVQAHLIHIGNSIEILDRKLNASIGLMRDVLRTMGANHAEIMGELRDIGAGVDYLIRRYDTEFDLDQKDRLRSAVRVFDKVAVGEKPVVTGQLGEIEVEVLDGFRSLSDLMLEVSRSDAFIGRSLEFSSDLDRIRSYLLKPDNYPSLAALHYLVYSFFKNELPRNTKPPSVFNHEIFNYGAVHFGLLKRATPTFKLGALRYGASPVVPLSQSEGVGLQMAVDMRDFLATFLKHGVLEAAVEMYYDAIISLFKLVNNSAPSKEISNQLGFLRGYRANLGKDDYYNKAYLLLGVNGPIEPETDMAFTLMAEVSYNFLKLREKLTYSVGKHFHIEREVRQIPDYEREYEEDYERSAGSHFGNRETPGRVSVNYFANFDVDCFVKAGNKKHLLVRGKEKFRQLLPSSEFNRKGRRYGAQPPEKEVKKFLVDKHIPWMLENDKLTSDSFGFEHLPNYGGEIDKIFRAEIEAAAAKKLSKKASSIGKQVDRMNKAWLAIQVISKLICFDRISEDKILRATIDDLPHGDQFFHAIFDISSSNRSRSEVKKIMKRACAVDDPSQVSRNAVRSRLLKFGKSLKDPNALHIIPVNRSIGALFSSINGF